MSDVLLVLLVVLGAVVVLRGPKTLPKLGEALGRAVRAARHELRDEPAPEDGAATPPDGHGEG